MSNLGDGGRTLPEDTGPSPAAKWFWPLIPASGPSSLTESWTAALGWAGRIRRHAEQTSPLNEELHVFEVSSCSHQEPEPHMNGWSSYGPYRH